MTPDIILTSGPASESFETLKKMAEIATRFRLNTSHMSPAGLKKSLADFARLFRETGKPLPVVLDLQGAKLRIGAYPQVKNLPRLLELRLASQSDDPGVIPVPHESVFAKAQVGDLLRLNDGKVVLQVTHQPDARTLRAECLLSGELSSGKGLNCRERIFDLDSVSSRDREAIEIGNTFPFVEYAVSFVGDGREGALFRPLVAGRRLSAKIERPAALSALTEIDREFDELWLCRGDLGAETELRDLGSLQAGFVREFPRLTRPKILAGEVLGSMIRSPTPSRSEIVHLHDILQAGFNGFVLSDETAAGSHVLAVLDFLGYFFKSGTHRREN